MKASLLLLAVLSVITGCASVVVSGDKLESRTASAIGSAPGQFTITNRVDDGIRTDFYVQTKTGKAYNCYVTGTIGVVSDAICTPVATTTKQSAIKQPAPQEQAAKPTQQTTASTKQKNTASTKQKPVPTAEQNVEQKLSLIHISEPTRPY